ncbi:MAG: FHA domain-containing protein [Planctomycetota bacterium]
MSELPPTHALAAAVVLQIAGRAGPAFRLDPAGGNVLGRASGSLVALADRLASRQHAAIRFDAETATWRLHDLGSRNGTWLDGIRITSAPLAAGGQIRIGTTELVFQPVSAQRLPHDDEPAAARVIRRGPPAELEGAALAQASAAGEESRWTMLLYQAGIRLLAAASRRDVVCTTLELAAEFTAGSSFAWLEPAVGGVPVPVCVVPPGSGLTARVVGAAWADATAGLAVWLDAEAPGEGHLTCVPLMEDGRMRAVLAAAGSLRAADFDLLLTLAGLGAAAIATREAAPDPTPVQAATTDPLDESEVFAADDLAPVDGTLALSAAELDMVRGGQLAEWLGTAGTLRLEDWERLLTVEALRRTGGGVPEAAALLGVSRATLYCRLDAYGLMRFDSRPAPS